MKGLEQNINVMKQIMKQTIKKANKTVDEFYNL
jgi:hypothetical protein